MQIVIPMSGFGERFRRAGYRVPKPLIIVENRPILAHVIDLFPGETELVFVCNREHLADRSFGLRDAIEQHCPTARIVGIAPHRRGPVHAVSQVYEALDPTRPVLINYCDFTCTWDFRHFEAFVRRTGCAGAIPAYRGFHPHSLGSTNYAYVRERDGWVEAIQEKQPYTQDRMQEFASSGSYYFRTAALMRDALDATVRNDLQVGGEYYVSLAYRHLLERGLPIAVYPLQHFMQWGTPEDLEEYLMWSNAFRALASQQRRRKPLDALGVVPMAGLGERFSRAGYDIPKPLIPVSGEPMVVQAVLDVGATERPVFVLRKDMPELEWIGSELERRFPGARLVKLDGPTDGQARSVELGLRDVPPELGPITITACDNGMLFDATKYRELVTDPDVDVIVWAVRGHANAVRNPHQYGWVETDGNRVMRVSVKHPLANPRTDPVVLGTFTFRRVAEFQRAAARMFEREARVNGEYYVDTLINDALALGLECRIFEVEHSLCWGTPNDLKTFEYWQSCFHKWEAHPYRLEHDSRVPASARSDLERTFYAWTPESHGLPRSPSGGSA